MLSTYRLKLQTVSVSQFMRFLSRKEYTKPIYTDPVSAVSDINSGSIILSGGFGVVGIPDNLLKGLEITGVKNLTFVSNNGGIDGVGIGRLISKNQVKRMISSYIGENKEFEKRYLFGGIEVEFTPQGTMIERVRAGAAGIPAFYTRTGHGTMIHLGGSPIANDKTGKPVLLSEPKESRNFDGVDYVMEKAITGDFALVRAWKADMAGNLIFRKTAQNFNSTMAKAAKVTIAEVEELLPVGALDPHHIHVPGIYVHRILHGVPIEKRIERLRLRQPAKSVDEAQDLPSSDRRVRIIRRAALELYHGAYVNLGIGLPTLLPDYAPDRVTVHLHAENGMLGLGPYPLESQVDPDLINAGKETVSELPGAAYMSSCDSFEMIRGGHINLSFMGAIEVSMHGDLANWIIPGKFIKGMGGAMDLAAAPNTKIIILTEHISKDGKPKIVENCSLPLTGKNCVDMIITDLCVFSVDPHQGLTLEEVAEGVDLEEVREKTGAPFKISATLSTMKQI